MTLERAKSTAVLGYGVGPSGGRLLVNQAEAERVREILSICTTIAQALEK